MGLLVSVLIGAVVALVFYWVATTLIVFAHSATIFGLIAFVIFLVVAFEGRGLYAGRRVP